MDWFRWHHGSVTDPKFALVARRSGQNVASVLAVWAALLERASQAEERGSVAGFDCESYDALLGLPDRACAAILEALADKGLLAAGRLTQWDKRQPLREREGPPSTARVRAFRERQRRNAAPGSPDASPDQTDQMDETDETPGNAAANPATPRLDQIRIEARGEGSARAPAIDYPPAPNPKSLNSPDKATPEWRAFLTCWAAYPVKQGQEEAWREWMRLRQTNALAEAWEVRDAILRMQASDSRWQRGKVPRLAKWLAGKGWNDEPYVEPAPEASEAQRGPARAGGAPPGQTWADRQNEAVFSEVRRRIEAKAQGEIL